MIKIFNKKIIINNYELNEQEAELFESMIKQLYLNNKKNFFIEENNEILLFLEKISSLLKIDNKLIID